jgi:hypothetical protein
VILKDVHVSTIKELEAKESIKKKIWNTFKSNPLIRLKRIYNFFGISIFVPSGP